MLSATEALNADNASDTAKPRDTLQRIFIPTEHLLVPSVFSAYFLGFVEIIPSFCGSSIDLIIEKVATMFRKQNLAIIAEVIAVALCLTHFFIHTRISNSQAQALFTPAAPQEQHLLIQPPSLGCRNTATPPLVLTPDPTSIFQ